MISDRFPTAFLVVLALIAFAANSVLCRLALAEGLIGPGAFTGIRLASGALVLVGLMMLSSGGITRHLRVSVWPALALLTYMAGFSFAYVTLETGTGALILFGGVQVIMFAGALLMREHIGPARWLGAGLGIGGLFVLFLPGASVPDLGGALLMMAAAVGWAIYTLLGRRVGTPLATTMASFLLACPAGLLIWAVSDDTQALTLAGLGLAVGSGAAASALGYAIWYGVLPRIDASLAGISQLTVPLIALGGGILVLGEPLTSRFLVAAIMILGGVALALIAERLRRRD